MPYTDQMTDIALTCAPISELPSNISTILSYNKNNGKDDNI